MRAKRSLLAIRRMYLAGHPGGAQVAEPDQLRQPAAARLHRLGDLAFELAELAVEAAQLLDPAQGEGGLDALLAGEQPLGSLEPHARVKVADLPLVAGAERDEVEMEPVRGPDPLGQKLGAVIAEQLQIAGERVDPHRRQPLFARGHPGDRQRVPRVALAVAAQALSLSFGQRAAHIDDLFAPLEQEAGDPTSHPAAAFDPEPALARHQLQHPGMQSAVRSWLVAEHARGELAAELVDQRDRERALVRIDPNRDHNDLLR
jgi:hypothetical protein